MTCVIDEVDFIERPNVHYFWYDEQLWLGHYIDIPLGMHNGRLVSFTPLGWVGWWLMEGDKLSAPITLADRDHALRWLRGR